VTEPPPTAYDAAPFVPNTRSIEALAAAAKRCEGCPLEIDRSDVYVTNAVKHFKHEARGKRRLHKKPGTAEVEACHPWLDAELRLVSAPVIVALGAVAARSLLGRPTPIASSRGKCFEVSGRLTLVTYHPSAVLRADDRATEVRAALVEDLRAAKRQVETRG